MTETEESEIKRITKLFHELPSISIEDAKQCAIRAIKLQIESLQKAKEEKCIVHWAEDKFNQLVRDKYQLLTELRKL